MKSGLKILEDTFFLEDIPGCFLMNFIACIRVTNKLITLPVLSTSGSVVPMFLMITLCEPKRASERRGVPVTGP